MFFSNKFSIFIVERLSSVVMLRTGKEIRFRFWLSEDKAGIMETKFNVFAHKPNSSGRLTGEETKGQIFKDAIRRAKEAIIFYTGLKDFARDPASEDTIDKIIRLLQNEWVRRS